MALADRRTEEGRWSVVTEDSLGHQCPVLEGVLPAVLPAISGTASRFLTRSDPLAVGDKIPTDVSILWDYLRYGLDGLKVRCSTTDLAA